MCTRQTGKLPQGSIVLATRIRFAPLTIPISLEIYVSFIARDSRRVLQRGAITTPPRGSRSDFPLVHDWKTAVSDYYRDCLLVSRENEQSVRQRYVYTA